MSSPNTVMTDEDREFAYQLTDEQKKLFDNLTEFNQKTAIGLLSGMTRRKAYEAAGGRATDPRSITAQVSKMFMLDEFKAFMDAMKWASISDAVMTKQEALERLTTLARTGIHDLADFAEHQLGHDEEGNPVIQSVWRIRNSVLQDPEKMQAIGELTAGRDGLKIKTHSPLQAIQQLAKMQGWDAAEKREITGADGGPLQVQRLDELSDDQLASIAAGAAE